MKLGEMFVELNFKADTYKVKDFAKTIANMPFSLAAAGAALVGMDLSFIAMTANALDLGTSLRVFTAATGEGTDQLERWQRVAGQVGLKNDVVTNSFRNMMGSISQLKTFGSGMAGQAFGRLGIHGFMEKSPNQLMAELRSVYRAQHTPSDIQKFWQAAGMIGIDPSMGLAFSSSLSDPGRMSRMGPVLGESGKRETAMLTAALANFTQEVMRDFVPVLVALIPVMKELADDLSAFLRWLHRREVHVFGSSDSIPTQLGKAAHGWLPNLIPGGGDWLDTHMDRLMGTGWQKSVAGVTVNQHFYGDVDRADIDAGTLSLEHSLIRASRQLNRGGR